MLGLTFSYFDDVFRVWVVSWRGEYLSARPLSTNSWIVVSETFVFQILMNYKYQSLREYSFCAIWQPVRLISKSGVVHQLRTFRSTRDSSTHGGSKSRLERIMP